MIVLRFTQNLLKDMKVTPAPIEHIPSLLSWHANIIKLNNRKYILLINDLSRLSLIIEGIRTSLLQKLIDTFRTTLIKYLEMEQIEQPLIELYLKDGQDVSISKTISKSVLGTMKEVTGYSTEILEFEDNYELMKWLNRIIHKPIDYYEPIKVFKEAIKKTYL